MKRVRIRVEGKWYDVEVDDLSKSPIQVRVDGESISVDVPGLPIASDAEPQSVSPEPVSDITDQAGDNIIRSPMPGRVVAVKVKRGKSVSPGDEVCVIEAMKMEQSIRTTIKGKVRKIHVKPTQQVESDDPLIEIDPKK